MRIPAILFLSLLFFSCSSTPNRPAFSDFLEIREVQADDPLALRYETRDGEEIRLGDPVLSGKNISRFQVKPGKTDLFDLYITLTGAEEARWRRFARSRGREAALVIDGKVRCLFEVPDPGDPQAGAVIVVPIPEVAETQEEADELERFLEDNKPVKSKSTSR
ncbi:hypothetical protein KQI65_10695 [bacterium]|nr:hypothetical protein [bacterium]